MCKDLVSYHVKRHHGMAQRVKVGRDISVKLFGQKVDSDGCILEANDLDPLWVNAVAGMRVPGQKRTTRRIRMERNWGRMRKKVAICRRTTLVPRVVILIFRVPEYRDPL